MPPPAVCSRLLASCLVVPVLGLGVAACGDSKLGSGSPVEGRVTKKDTKTTDSRPGY